jgi:hypothetical protein
LFWAQALHDSSPEKPVKLPFGHASWQVASQGLPGTQTALPERASQLVSAVGFDSWQQVMQLPSAGH